MFNMGGLLSSLLTFDFGKAVIENEIGLMLKRINRGLEFSTENLSLELISKVGNGGSYMDQADTFNRMRKTALMPSIAFRDVRAAWEKMGKSDAHSRALTEATKILTRDNPAVLSPQVDAKIRARFKGLTAGNAGWS